MKSRFDKAFSQVLNVAIFLGIVGLLLIIFLEFLMPLKP